jgi:molecular chaperone DnaK (HSP70)
LEKLITWNCLGCAIANSSKIRNVSDKALITENIEVLKRWPGAGNQAVEKTPSVLAYDNDFTRVVAWGSSVGDQHKNQFAHFKLLLHRPTNSDSASVDDLAWKLQATSIRSSSLPRGKTAVDVTADYLRPLYQYIQQILSNTYGEKFLASQTLSYVITVPALWSDRSKALTQRAASEAGLVTEPEAAALYCATICDEVDLRVGSKFLGDTFRQPGSRRLTISLRCRRGDCRSDIIRSRICQTIYDQ